MHRHTHTYFKIVFTFVEAEEKLVDRRDPQLPSSIIGNEGISKSQNLKRKICISNCTHNSKYLAESKLTFFKTGVIKKEPEKVCADYKNNEKKEKQMNRTSQGESVNLAILKQLNSCH